MEELSIVRRRSRVWPIVLAVLLLAAIVLAVLWFIGDRPAVDIGWNGADGTQLINLETVRRHLSVIA